MLTLQLLLRTSSKCKSPFMWNAYKADGSIQGKQVLKGARVLHRLFIESAPFPVSIVIFWWITKVKLGIFFNGIVSVFKRMYTYLNERLHFSSSLKITSKITVIESGMECGWWCFQYNA